MFRFMKAGHSFNDNGHFLFLLALFFQIANATAQSALVYEGYLERQEVTIMTHGRCAPGGAFSADTVRYNLPVEQREVALASQACGWANFTGKFVFDIPSKITATLVNDSVLVFQNPAKATISATTSGTATQISLIDTLWHSLAVYASVNPGVGALVAPLVEKCPKLSDVFTDASINKPGNYNLSATARCDEIDYLLGYTRTKATSRDTLEALILSIGQTILSYGYDYTVNPYYFLYERGAHQKCYIWSYYKFVRKGQALEEIGVWQDISLSGANKFSGSKDNIQAEFDGCSAEIVQAGLDSIVVRVPPELVGDRTDINQTPGQTAREVTLIVKVKQQNLWVEVFRRRFRFNPPRPLLYDEVTRANPPLVQATMRATGARWRQSFMFLGYANDGTAAVRMLNTSTQMTPLTLLGKVISPPRLPNYPRGELFDASNNPNYGNLLNIGICNAGIQFAVTQNGWYIIAVEAAQEGITGGSKGPLPSMYQIHLCGNVGLPRKIINGRKEVARATRLDTYFNHPAPRSETLVNAGPGMGSFAETALFKFANPVTAVSVPLAVLLPPAGFADGFPFGIPPVRAQSPALVGQFPNGIRDLSTPMAVSPGVLNPVAGTVIDLAQVPIPASVEATGVPFGIGAILGGSDSNCLTLPYQGFSTIILDMGSGQEIVDETGADLRVYGCQGSYRIGVSQTPFDNTFVNLGNGAGVQDFDLAGSGLTVVRYVRLTVVGASAEIDAVHGLNFLCDAASGAGPMSDVASATITMRRDKSPNNALDPMLELYAPDGSSWGKNESGFGDDVSEDRSDAALVNKELTMAGFYRFLGRGYDTQPDAQAFGVFYTRLETGGSYDQVELTISAKDEEQTVAQKRGVISATRQRDSYLFQATPGATIRIAVNGLGSPALPDPLVELYDPEDFLIAANDDYPNRGKRAALEVTLPKYGRNGALPNPSTWRVVVMGVDSHSNSSTAASGGSAWVRQVNGGHYELKVFNGAFSGGSSGLQPQISGIAPNILACGAADQTITITGQNFNSNAVLSFNRSGITVTWSSVISSTEIRATISVAQNAYLGGYDVMITQGVSSRTTFNNSLQIKASLGKIALSWQAPETMGSLPPPSGLTAQYGPAVLHRAVVGGKTALKNKQAARHLLASSYIDVGEVEPNNSISQAQVLPADSIVSVAGHAEMADEGQVQININDTEVDDLEDLFKITTMAPGLTLILYGFDYDCDLYLLDRDAMIVEYSMIIGASTFEFIEVPDLPAGDYYIGVSIFDPNEGSDYTFYQLDVFGAMKQTTPTTLLNYHIYRSAAPGAMENGQRVATVAANVLQYSDAIMANGTWHYQVTAEYDFGESEPSDEVQCYATQAPHDESTTAGNFTLYQNHPNPFNPTTMIRFSLPEKSAVTLSIYDILGKWCATLLQTTMAAGEYQIPWHAGTWPSGIYIARLQSNTEVQQMKMMLIK